MKFLFLFLFFIGILCPLASSSIPDVIHCDRYSIDAGLSSNLVYGVQQDRHGFIWVTTNGGLSRFDGYDFTVFQHESGNPNSLSNDDISGIMEDPDDFFWIGTYKGLNSLDLKNNKIVIYGQIPDDLQEQRKYRVTFLLQDDEGQIWIGTRGGGLGCLDKTLNDFIWYQNQSGDDTTLRSNMLYVAAKERSGNFLIGIAGGGLERFDPKTGVVEHLLDRYRSPKEKYPDILRIWIDQNDTIWFGTWNNGLARLDTQNNRIKWWTHDPQNPNSLSNNIIQSLIQDKSGKFWIGTRGGGIDLFDPTTETFRHAVLTNAGTASPGKTIILVIYQDTMGGFWFGTLDQGLYHYDPNAAWFDLYRYDPSEPGGLSDNRIYAFSEDLKGAIWIGTDGGGLNRFNPETNTFTVYRHDPNKAASLLKDSVISLLTDRKGNLWVGYWFDGFGRFDPQTETFQHFRESPNGLHGNSVRALCEDSQGRIWIGTENAGITVYNPETGDFTYYPYDSQNKKGISDQYIRCMFRDRKNTLWIGTAGYGLNRYDPSIDGFIVYQNISTSLSSLSGNMIASICEDLQGQLWVGTEAGLNRMNPDQQTFTRYTIKDGLPSNLIKAIQVDDSGNLWISTERGLSRFDIQNDTFQNFDTRDRLQGLSFNTGCSCKSKSGILYFGGLDGFNGFDPDSIPRNENQPPILINSFKVSGQSVKWEEWIRKNNIVRLPYNKNSLEFEFTALNYTRSYRNQYSYQMIGLDEKPTNPTKRRYVQYTSLQPGRYEFRVTGSNNDGVWNEKGISIPIVITPPFWDTLWFRILVGGCLIAVFAFSYEYRIRSIQKRRIELQQEVERQTRRIKEQSLELERVNQELERLSFLDGLTNIPNRRRFEECMEREWKRAQRNQEPVSLIMIDIDLFKKFNDTYGHQAGDDCLRRVAHEIQSNTKRPVDLAARFGGEEFVVLLPETQKSDSFHIAETIRKCIENMKIPHAQSDLSDYVTLSLGGATLIPSQNSHSDVLIHMADKSLYRAKNEGRNRTKWANEE